MSDSPPKLKLKLGLVTSSMFSENAYFLHLEGRSDCVVIDPGFDSDDLLAYLDDRSLAPAAILNTHGHIDHIAGNAALKARFPAATLIVGAGDAIKLVDATENLSGVYGFPIVSPAADRLVRAGERIEAAGLEFEVVEAPGHSSGHVAFLWKGSSPWLLFGGDVLFAGGIGRTDFPDGDTELLLRSIREQFFTLPDETRVFPGHGPSTTIGVEKRDNPFVGRAH